MSLCIEDYGPFVGASGLAAGMARFPICPNPKHGLHLRLIHEDFTMNNLTLGHHQCLVFASRVPPVLPSPFAHG